MGGAVPAIDRFAAWYEHAALPLWAAAAWDETHGGFFESLDFTGKPIRGTRRVRVQSRQVYTFSRVAALGWLPEGEALADKGFDWLIERACPDEAARGCVHLVNDKGEITDDRRDLYDQAFLLLACAARIEAGSARASEIAAQVMTFLDKELASPHGGWLESDRRETPRRQNPHMHLFEAFMALFRASGDEAWKSRAQQVADLFDARFFDGEAGALREFFSEDLASLDAGAGDKIEPGHMAEWVWLLGAFEQISDANYADRKTVLYHQAVEYADAKTGFLPDSVRLGAPAPASCRLWPQTELIRANFALAKQADDAFASVGANVINALFSSYLDQPVKGLWCDQFDAEGAPVARDVPASILYHLFEAVAETVRFKDRQGKS